jgi:hypothetical protein
MFGKNTFRTFLYFVVGIVLLKLCYNLGYGLVNKRLRPATQVSPAQNETSSAPTLAPADSAEAARVTTAPQ